MIAELFVKRIIDGDNGFNDVPPKIKQDVAQKLIDKGYDSLVPTSYGGKM